MSGHAVGVDVGGTTTKAVLVDAEGTVLRTERRPTPSPDPTGRLVAAVVADVVAALDPAGALPVGVDVPGVVDTDRGVAVRSVNLGWTEVPLQSLLEEAVRRPVVLEHDVRAAAAAELAGDEFADGTHAFVAVGTGISAAIVLHGQLVVSGGWAGEIGQLVLTGGPCAGRTVEQVGSATAIAARAGAPDARTVVGRLASDGAARDAWEDGVAALATGIAALVVSVAPQSVTLGGGLAGAGEVLLAPLREALQQGVRTVRQPTLRLARYGDLAAALGASILASRGAGR